MEDTVIHDGDYVLIILNEKKNFLVKVKQNERFHTHKGYVDMNDIIGKRFGSIVKTNKNFELFLAKPNLYDIIKKIQRKTQIIYPKDAAYVIFISNINSGSKVVEIGTGSGALTIALAYHVRPEGHVYTYDINEEFIELAKKNAEKFGLINYVTFKNKNPVEGIEEKEVDSVIIDIGNPWDVVKPAKEALKDSGMIVAFCPTVNQVEKLTISLRENNFKDIHGVELIEREYQTETGKIRPRTVMIGHTGYIIYARKSSF